MGFCVDPLNAEALARQADLQRRMAWDADADLPWAGGVDLGAFLLPLDDDALAFPGASAEQRLALSQYFGLVVNATIAEMEDALPKLRFSAWVRLLEAYPANPELRDLGELFFDEEAKHSRAFGRYLTAFCEALGLDPQLLGRLLPKAFGSHFQRAIAANAQAGGHAFWWVVAAVEEVSIEIYRQIHRCRDNIDPLYRELHRRHLEEEARHANYAFLMLELAARQPKTLRARLHQKADFVLAQVAGAPWVLTELYKFFEVKRLGVKHPFLDTLASCIPLYESQTKVELVRRMFFAAPYVSWLLNPGWRDDHRAMVKRHGALVPPLRPPQDVNLSADQSHPAIRRGRAS